MSLYDSSLEDAEYDPREDDRVSILCRTTNWSKSGGVHSYPVAGIQIQSHIHYDTPKSLLIRRQDGQQMTVLFPTPASADGLGNTALDLAVEIIKRTETDRFIALFEELEGMDDPAKMAGAFLRAVEERPVQDEPVSDE